MQPFQHQQTKKEKYNFVQNSSKADKLGGKTVRNSMTNRDSSSTGKLSISSQSNSAEVKSARKKKNEIHHHYSLAGSPTLLLL